MTNGLMLDPERATPDLTRSSSTRHPPERAFYAAIRALGWWRDAELLRFLGAAGT